MRNTRMQNYKIALVYKYNSIQNSKGLIAVILDGA